MKQLLWWFYHLNTLLMMRANWIYWGLVTFKGVLFGTSCGIPNLRIRNYQKWVHDFTNIHVKCRNYKLCILNNLDKLVVPTGYHRELLIGVRKCKIIYSTNMSINLEQQKSVANCGIIQSEINETGITEVYLQVLTNIIISMIWIDVYEVSWICNSCSEENERMLPEHFMDDFAFNCQQI